MGEVVLSDSESAIAYLNWGRWVADCPREGCSGAVALEPGQQVYFCTPPAGCGQTAPILWPAQKDSIEAKYGTAASNNAFDAVNPAQSWRPGDDEEGER